VTDIICDEDEDTKMVKVFCLDYGFVRDVALSHLFTLPPKLMSVLRYQAVECSLFNVAPQPEEEWSEKSGMKTANNFDHLLFHLFLSELL
jgi:hypothetical protein